MAAAASVLLLLVARILFLLMRLWSCPIARPESQEKENLLRSLSYISHPWGRSLQWNTLPFTLSRPEKPSPETGNGAGVVLPQKRSQVFPILNWKPRTGPQFQPPRKLSPHLVSHFPLTAASSACAV